MLNIPDLNRLKVFYAIYMTRSFVKASRLLHITRSAVSQALKALEEELQTKLFYRDSKNVLPTEPADQLFRAVEPFLSELAATMNEMETGKTEAVGHLRIGAPQDFGSIHLTEAVIDFRKKNPRVTFELFLSTPVVLMEMLSAGKLDLGFVDNGDIHARNHPVSIQTVMRERFVPVCAAEYFDRYIKRRGVRFENLKELHFVDYLKHAPVSKMWIKHHFGKPSPDLNVVFCAESVRAVTRAVLGGLGIGVIPEHMIEEDLGSRHLRRVVKGRELINQITLARRLERPISGREKAFVDFYKKRADLR